MYKNGRGNSSRSGRRGNVRRKQYVGIIAAVLVIYIVYRSFKSDSDETKFESLKTSKLSQKLRVQGELRNKAMESEKPFNVRPDLTRAEVVGDIIIEEGDIKSNEEKSGDDNNNSPAGGEVIPGLTDRYHLAKSALDEINQKDLTQDNTTSIKSNKTFSPESPQPKDSVISLNITKVTRNLTESNLTLSHEPAEHTDPVSHHNNGNITFKTTTLNTSSIHGVETGNRGSHGVVNNDVEEYKVKLTEEFAAQTKQLVLLMKETLTKNGTSLLEFNSQNKTKDKNVTNFVESFSAKANNVLSLAKNLLMDKNRSIPSTNQSNMRLNDTQLEKLFSVESQGIMKFANEVFSKTNETGLEEKGDAKAKFLDKYSFHAQQLRKFASTLLSNQTKLVANTQQKLLNIEVPKDSKLPAQTSNMTVSVTN